MKKSWLRLCAMAFVALSMSIVHAARTVDGVLFKDNFAPSLTLSAGIYEVKASLSAQTSVGGGTFKNQYRYPVNLLAGAVVKPVLASVKDTRADLYCTLIITNGTVTLDLTGLDASVPFRFQGGLWIEGDGGLVIKGRDALVVGQETSDYDANVRTVCAIRAPQLAFVDANGDAYANPTGVTLMDYVAEIRLPTNVPWAIAPGATIVEVANGAGGQGVYDRYVSNDAMTLSAFDLKLLSAEAFGQVAVTVNEGRTFSVYPRTFVFEGVDAFNYNGASSTVYDNDVILNGGTYYLGNHYESTHNGNISGHGHLVFSPTSRQNGTSKTTIAGAATFTGDILVSCGASSQPASTLVFKQASPGADGNAVTISSGSTLRLEPSTTPAAGSIASLTAGAGATNYIGSGVTLTVSSEPTGEVVFVGAGPAKSTLVADYMPSPGRAIVGSQCAVRVSAAAQAATVRASLGLNDYYLCPQTDGTVDLSRFVSVPAASGQVVVSAKDGSRFINVPSNVTVTAASGVSATVSAIALHTLNVEAAAGASITASEATADWESSVLAHFDFSTADWNGYPDGYPDGNTRTRSGLVYPIVSNIAAKVGPYYLECEKSYYTPISPHLMTNACNGLSYLSFDDRGGASGCVRVDVRSASTKERTTLQPEFAVVVFGSQAGGGGALFGDSAKEPAFLRGNLVLGGTNKTGQAFANRIADRRTGLTLNGNQVTKDYGLFTNDAISCWLDGAKVAKPSEQALNGGWQIVSVDMDGRKFSGLGNVNTEATNCGGQNYAEIIFFSKKLDEGQRLAVERQLAQKWGVSTYVDAGLGTRMTVLARGAGTVTLGKDATLSAGSFRGTLNLNGKSLEMAAASLPPDRTALRTAAEPMIWFDPEATAALEFQSEGKVSKMYDWRSVPIADYPDGKYYVDAVSRVPLTVTSAREEGPVRTWLEYSPKMFDTKNASGRGLRFKKKGSEGASIYNVQPATVRTVIMAQDSSKTGGTPFMDAVTGSDLPPRNPKYADNGPTPAGAPIWVGKAATLFSTGATYLDGRKVDGASAGFQGRPEILTAVGGADFKLGSFGHVSYLDGHVNDVDEGEIQGEILAYDSVLTDAARRTAEAYLAWKWCGTAISGYAVYTNLTISGSGSVKVNAFDQMPKFASDYTGNVDLPFATSLGMTVTRGSAAVVGAQAFSGTVRFPAAVTLNVSFDGGKPKAGSYDLVTAAGGLADTVWTLNASADVAATVEVSATAVRLVVAPQGMTMILR